MNNNSTTPLPVHLHNYVHEDPYYMIAEFFSFTSLDSWRLWLANWFKAAFDEDYILKESPANFLYAADQLQLLLYACSSLIDKNATAPKAAETGEAPGRPMLKLRREIIIKHLTVNEIVDALRVVKNFFSFQSFKEWQLTLELWKEAALGRTSVTGLQDSGTLLPVMEYLYKIAEAAWLLLNTQQLDDNNGQEVTSGSSFVQGIL